MRPILLTLMLALLLTGSGEAEEKIKIIDIPTSGCTAGQTWNGKELPPPTCEQRMREAMRAMNPFVPRVYDKESSVIEGWMKNEHTSQAIAAARKQWDHVYKDCVKETP